MENITSEKRAICGVCPAGCWIIAGYDKEGRLAAVRPEEGTEFGITCKLGDHGPAIVYAATRKSAEELGAALGKRRAAVYHAGMEATERRQTQEAKERCRKVQIH